MTARVADDLVVTGPVDHQVVPRTAAGSATVSWCVLGCEDVRATVRGPLADSPHVRVQRLDDAVDVSAQLPTGGPYEIELEVWAGADRIGRHVVRGLLVGDVWVLAGQSNMQGVGEGAAALPPLERAAALGLDGRWRPASEPLHRLWQSPDNTQLRLFHLPNSMMSREDVLAAYPEMHERDAVEPIGGVGPGYFFARDLASLTGVPVGLIPCALGGSGLELWSKAWAGLHAPGDPSGSLYSNLIDRASAWGPVRGVLWYEGESEAMSALGADYAGLFAELVNDVRTDLKQPDLAFLTAQLGTFDVDDPHFAPIQESLSREWDLVREAQRKAASLLHRVAVVTAADLPRVDLVHVATRGHERLGRRLALQAAGLVRGDELGAGPDVSQVALDEDGTLRIVIEGLRGRLQSPVDPRSFVLSDSPARVVSATVVEPDTVVLSTDVPVGPEACLGYGLGPEPIMSLYDDTDFPVPCFGPIAVNEETST